MGTLQEPFCLCGCSSLEGEVHCSIEQAVSFIEERITEESRSSRPLRGPYLAKLELIRRLRHRGCNDEYKLGKEQPLLGEEFIFGREGEKAQNFC